MKLSKSQSVSQEQVKAYPGKLLGSATDYQHGQGTYIYLNQIYASTKGFV